jgi:mono/diheme cytochrome c family protein
MPLKVIRTETGQENYDALLGAGALLALLLFVALSVYWLGDQARLASAAGELLSERVARGQAIYAAQCTACHGQNGEGGVGPALNNRRVLQNTPDEIFFAVIRSGVPNTQMPSWSVDYGGPLTDEDLRDTVAFLRSWEPTAPEIVVQAREPDPARGALLFASTCAICHGENGAGGQEGIPALNEPARLQQFDDAWYRGVIANGRPARGMPTWGTVLAPEQLDDLVALIAAWREGRAVPPAFSVTGLIEQALFALSQEDLASARLQVERAAVVAQGPGAAVLESASAQLQAGDLAGAEETLQALQADWPLGDPGAGAQVYSASCAPCHGVQGEGGIGKALHPNAFVQEQTNAELVAFLLAGRPGTAMSGFEGRLPETELADLVAFLRLWQ